MMTAFEFLEQEFENVTEALNDSLRHDYGPAGSDDYFKECNHRLTELHNTIAAVDPDNGPLIADKLDELDGIASWISLIERSHLGEFSWPFANTLRQIATKLLAEGRLRERPSLPIVHIIGGGGNYEIRTEGPVSAYTKSRRFVIVSFPRSLKHHVLLHALFGHELGHAVISTVGVPGLLRAIQLQGPMKNEAELTNWLHLPKAPNVVKRIIQAHKKRTGKHLIVGRDTWEGWAAELSCDLFGLVLFGPAFAAATCTFLQFREKHPYLVPPEPDEDISIHPPYACRHKLLVQALRLLGWDKPITKASIGPVHKAEKAMLACIGTDNYHSWARLFTDEQIRSAVASIQSFLSAHSLQYVPPMEGVLKILIDNLADRIPPVATLVTKEGATILNGVSLPQVLHAGWVYWLGRDYFQRDPPTFLQTNRLCHLGLIQNDAVQKTIDEPSSPERNVRNTGPFRDRRTTAR